VVEQGIKPGIKPTFDDFFFKFAVVIIQFLDLSI
jgi:hypothetical protein